MSNSLHGIQCPASTKTFVSDHEQKIPDETPEALIRSPLPPTCEQERVVVWRKKQDMHYYVKQITAGSCREGRHGGSDAAWVAGAACQTLLLLYWRLSFSRALLKSYRGNVLDDSHVVLPFVLFSLLAIVSATAPTLVLGWCWC